ncbi:helix-turn-helix transcriptional regulator [Pseudarthrobacter sp. P1]|uniref:helix-turn-helix transcriptional regulator n=1 Tax=Pseudarthrobacter sp. P1 TaxID=3418418 RepID=UPI003CEBEDAA
MAGSWAHTNGRAQVERLCRAGLDEHELRAGVLRELRKAVGFDAYVWPLADPASAVGITPMAAIPCPQELPLLIRLKYLTPLNRWTALAQAPTPAATLLAATDGVPGRSLLWDALLRRHGVADMLSVVFAQSQGCWGWLDLWRIDANAFDDGDTVFVASLAPALALALRDCRARQFTAGATLSGTMPPAAVPSQAVLVLDEDLAVLGQTGSAVQWLDLLQRGPEPYAGIPAEVLNVAAQLLAAESGVDAHPAWSRVRVGGGIWADLRAARMAAAPASSVPPIAATIQQCLPAARLGVFARSFAFTHRERELLRLAATGLDTAGLARRQGVARYTVQDQFKSIFAKCGVHSRAALLALALGTTAGAPPPDLPPKW